MVKLNGSTRKSVVGLQRTFICEDLSPGVSSLSSSVSTHHQEEQKKHRGDEIHTNMDEFPLLSRGFDNPILPSAKANLRKLVKCCLEFLTIVDSLACLVPFPKRPFRRQITDSNNATIDYKIPLLGAGT